ncbi:hypothetical protein [Pseudomonas sp. Pseusp16]|uniref:hypothetical protein n=1 Tax=Pseudomonas sp. Pseusp16 TaxID=3243021 RepID=UPI0039B6A5C3
MKVFRIIALLVISPFSIASSYTVNYSFASDVNSGRAGGVLARYVKTFENECLEVEVISVKPNPQVLQGMSLCSFEGKPFSIGFAHAGFQNIFFAKDGVHLDLAITSLDPTGEEIRKCFIPVLNWRLSALQCSSVIG